MVVLEKNCYGWRWHPSQKWWWAIILWRMMVGTFSIDAFFLRSYIKKIIGLMFEIKHFYIILKPVWKNCIREAAPTTKNAKLGIATFKHATTFQDPKLNFKTPNLLKKTWTPNFKTPNFKTPTIIVIFLQIHQHSEQNIKVEITENDAKFGS